MRQGYNDRLDDSMGARNGKKSQSMKLDAMKAWAWKSPWETELIQAI
jgi:hypothetical protein